MTLTRSHVRARRGFTLIESMATISILATLSSIASFLILDAVDAYTDAATSAQLHGEASIALDRAVREMRRIDLDSTAGGVAPDINNVTTTWLDWEDSVGGVYQLLYNAGEKALKIEISGGGLAVLLGDVTGCTFSTYDEDNDPLAATLTGVECDDIRRIELSVTVARAGISETVRTRVFIRSTMSGAQGGS